MKVVIVGGYAPALISFRGHLIADMVRAGHSVVACAPGEHPEVAAGLAERGARYLPISMNRTGMNPLAEIGSLFFLRRVLRRLRPDLVLSYTPKGVIHGSGAARLAGIPRIYSMITGLGYPFIEGRELRRRLIKRTMLALYRRSLAYSRAVFFQNGDDLDEFRRLRLISDQQTVVRVEGSGVDTEHFAAAPVPEGPPAFLLIARLLRDKGILEYVEAARRLRARHPGVAFRLLGPPDDHPNAIGPEQLDRWGEEGVIEYLGETSDVRPYLSSSTVYVLPSYREGMPRTVLEAMSMGRAVITTDVPGCRETVVPSHNGFLVPLRDAAALAGAMERFILQPHLALAMGARSREIALERFDVRRVNAVMLRAMELA